MALSRAAVYGWIVAIIFVFFYNLWPSFVAALFGRRAVVNRIVIGERSWLWISEVQLYLCA